MSLYQILEVTNSATDEEIKKAYRRLAIKYHPDKNNEVDALSKFQEINNAYSILSNPQRRKVYDITGQTEVNAITNDFSQFFTRRMVYELVVSFELLLNGGTRTIKNRETEWVDMHGRPAQLVPCTACRTFGNTILVSCQVCKGKKKVPPPGSIPRIKTTEYTVEIPENSWIGRTIEANDRTFELNVEDTVELHHENLDLVYVHTLSIFEALLAEPLIVEIVGKKYRLTFTGPINSHTRIIYEGKGLFSSKGHRGDLIIFFKIIFPEKLTENQRKHLEVIVSEQLEVKSDPLA